MSMYAACQAEVTMKDMLTLKAVHDFPVNDKIDEEYVRSFVEWDEKTPTGIGDAAQVEKYARLFAIEKAGLRPYYQELIRPQVEAIQAKVLKEYNEWHASEDYQWLRNYLLTNTNGSVEEIEKLISPNHKIGRAHV